MIKNKRVVKNIKHPKHINEKIIRKIKQLKSNVYNIHEIIIHAYSKSIHIR